jgi:DNA invertase Pin-like site-specific DNA recombinase
MQKIKRVALFVRVCTSEQSTKAQESELREYIKNPGWLLARIYADQRLLTLAVRSSMRKHLLQITMTLSVVFHNANPEK